MDGNRRVSSETPLPRRRLRPAILLVAGLALAAGCRPANLVRSTGTVRFDGQPVETGAVVFRPVGSGGAPAGGLIRSGSFSLEGPAGRQRVEIRGMRPVDESRLPRTMPRFEGMPVHEDYIPSAYNTASTLEVEVSPDGPNVFTFDLPAASPRP
jgi:hypothetical protein